MAKLTLTDPSSFVNDATAVSQQAANNAAIEAALENTLSRDGTSPNQMLSQLDMNSYRIINLPAATYPTDPVRLSDLEEIYDIALTGTSGHTVPFLDGNNTWSGLNTFSVNTTFERVVSQGLSLGIAGGNPVSSGTSDANEFLVTGNTNVRWRAGLYSTGALWLQPSSVSNYGTSYNTVINPVGGNVGIGTTSTVSAKLHVNGTGYFTGTVGIGGAPSTDALTITSNGSTVNQLRLKDSTGGHVGALVSQGNSGAFLFNNQDNASLAFYTNNGSGEGMVLGAGGAGLTIGLSPSSNAGQNGLYVQGVIKGEATTASTSTSTGALVISGGAGIAGRLNVGGMSIITPSVTGDPATSGTSQTGLILRFATNPGASLNNVLDTGGYSNHAIFSYGMWLQSGNQTALGSDNLIPLVLNPAGNNIFAGGPLLAENSVLSKHATAGIGYRTGAGGTVTQATSKSTGVTLNKVTGKITMNNAALAAATIVSFTVTCSAVVATDSIAIAHESGGTLGAYTVNARATGAGTFAVDIRNNTAGSLSEALVLRYAIIKSVDS